MTARQSHLVFDTKIGGTKPVTVVDNGHKCPFCCRDELEGIIAEDGPILLIANKTRCSGTPSRLSSSKPMTAHPNCRYIQRTTFTGSSVSASRIGWT
ncbi:protein of unknown function [Sporomusa malonica]|uniref:DUF4931 domain-containing protein n=1 Tax=Sporomusa malonica TaxID=112901 RepID=A0A1W2DT16_9FIRM|nr:protein of unknown function [Sporomusa malonica]